MYIFQIRWRKTEEVLIKFFSLIFNKWCKMKDDTFFVSINVLYLLTQDWYHLVVHILKIDLKTLTLKITVYTMYSIAADH